MTFFNLKILGSIRAKVWLCVLVAFFGFILAAVASFRFTGIVSRNLTELQQIDFKVAILASNALSSFKEQSKLYEGAFLGRANRKMWRRGTNFQRRFAATCIRWLSSSSRADLYVQRKWNNCTTPSRYMPALQLIYTKIRAGRRSSRGCKSCRLLVKRE